ncbi:hypothetical protein, partial [Klebsiella pneumoniae]|uniref:hypothetical protein n=1 Tax=Klebsiella pneumoniae TaxID=573 RepID=UPI00313654AD
MTNPLPAPSDLPFGLPDFAAITIEHVEPAFDQALRAHAQEISEILMHETPTWENTVEALECAGAQL